MSDGVFSVAAKAFPLASSLCVYTTSYLHLTISVGAFNNEEHLQNNLGPVISNFIPAINNQSHTGVWLLEPLPSPDTGDSYKKTKLKNIQ